MPDAIASMLTEANAFSPRALINVKVFYSAIPLIFLHMARNEKSPVRKTQGI
jgi:hypothetical protein